MKNKISGKIVALLLTLIIVATSGMPLYAKETGDKANSFRYENGQPIIESIPLLIGFLVLHTIIHQYTYLQEFGDLLEDQYNIAIW